MAPRNATAPALVPPTPTAVAVAASKTVSGFAIGLTAFIPVDPKDLRKQSEIPMILLDIQEGKKDVSALLPYLKQIEFRQQHVRKRVTEAEYTELFAVKGPAKVETEEGDEPMTKEEVKHDPETGEIEE